ncbi:RNA polymerase sigma-70 factor [uncultured Kriegella sp.]|uniref:RNA polymerase sigma factor n=1 Tax=uncultured Kriegella sp. TaxID=1798910 RepID=UPI0030DD067F|tara:strand:- start:136780 stop:137379 length:600 start_codon:yes stop_codon:yes gene_type:complete
MTSYFGDSSLLAHQLLSGNSKAYDFLMDSYYKMLCAYAYTLTKDHANAEDIVQNVFVEVWVNRKKINPNLSIKNYMYKSVYNEFIDQYRKNKPVIYLEKKYMEAIDVAVENEREDIDELIRLVNKEIEKLPSKCKKIFVLNKKEGLTHTEISEHLDISLKTVEGHMTRAFKILGKQLGVKVEHILFLLFDFGNKLNRQR